MLLGFCHVFVWKQTALLTELFALAYSAIPDFGYISFDSMGTSAASRASLRSPLTTFHCSSVFSWIVADMVFNLKIIGYLLIFDRLRVD
jgi:hypothetical protein